MGGGGGTSSSEREDFADLFGNEEELLPRRVHPTEKLIEYTCPSDDTKLMVRTVGHHVLWANYLWNGAHWMSDYIDTHPSEFKDKKILELGAGAGLPSILSIRVGAKMVIVTDYPDEELVINMQKNIDTLLTSEQRSRISAKGFLWGADSTSLTTIGGRFDIIIMCDVIFNHSEHRKLLATIRDTLEVDGIVWCVFSHYRPWFKERDLALLELASEFGLKVEHVETLRYEETVFQDDRADPDSLRTVYAYRLSFLRDHTT
jgi:nicotinamide N-methyltransferase